MKQKGENFNNFERYLVVNKRGFASLVVNSVAVRKMLRKVEETPLVFLVAGPSESGKSHFGETFWKLGGGRIKILKVVADLQDEGEIPITADPREVLVREGNPWEGARQQVLEYIAKMLQSRDVLAAAVESISYPKIVTAFRKRSSLIRALTIYFNPPKEVRVVREAKAKGLPKETVKKMVEKKDVLKKELGLDMAREMADILVVNAGPISIFDEFIGNLFKLSLKAVRKYNGSPFEYK